MSWRDQKLVRFITGQTFDISDKAARLLGHVSVDTGGTMVGQAAMVASLPVVMASDQSAVPVSNANLDVALSTRLKPADTLTKVATVDTLTNALPAGTNRIGAVRPVDSTDADLTAAKGSQTSRAVGTQDLKDAGRSQIMLSWEEMAGTAAAESALTNFTLGSKAVAALTAANSYTVSTGKTLRIQVITVYVKSTSTAAILARYRIRQAASSIANNSPVIFDTVMGLDAATFASGQLDEMSIPIPDGLEVAASQQITFTWFTNANTCTVGMSITGYEY